MLFGKATAESVKEAVSDASNFSILVCAALGVLAIAVIALAASVNTMLLTDLNGAED